MQYYGDGPSYDASRVVPRNLTGFAPGNYECPKTPMRESQTLPKLNERFDNLSAAADEGRLYGTPAGPTHVGYPNEDLSGRTHPEAVVMDRFGKVTQTYEKSSVKPMDTAYFDAVKLMQVLRQQAHEAQQRAWRLETALRNYRRAESDHEQKLTLQLLTETYKSLYTPDMKAAIEVEDMIATIEQA